MWYAIIASLILAVAGGLIYISFRSARFAFVQKLTGGRKWAARLFCLLFWAGLTALLWLIWNMMNALVCLVHLTLIWLLCDLGGFLISGLRRKKAAPYRAGAAAIALCVLWMTGGWIADHHVWRTEYRFETQKAVGSFRIVQITDSHIGATFDAEGFSAYMEEISGLCPDVVVVTGDFVDDDTTRADMLGGCEALGRLRTNYGVYFVWGNHDSGYRSEAARGWTNAELRAALAENGVVLLEDEARLVDGRIWIVGRKDRSADRGRNRRQTAEELLASLDREKYVVLLDHQPYDFDAEAEAGADLVLCGHTHGGQFIPINHVGEWIGENCLRYGHERRLQTDFIVSSGISNWTFRFKTGCFSEYVVIDLEGT